MFFLFIVLKIACCHLSLYTKQFSLECTEFEVLKYPCAIRLPSHLLEKLLEGIKTSSQSNHPYLITKSGIIHGSSREKIVMSLVPGTAALHASNDALAAVYLKHF
jgi:hypothetical protein